MHFLTTYTFSPDFAGIEILIQILDDRHLPIMSA